MLTNISIKVLGFDGHHPKDGHRVFLFLVLIPSVPSVSVCGHCNGSALYTQGSKNLSGYLDESLQPGTG